MMTTKTQQPKGQDGVLSSLNKAIDALNGAKEATSMTPAKAAFASAGVLLAMIKDSMINKVDYVELGLACTNVCEALNRGMDRNRADQLSQSVLEAIAKLTTATDDIQRHIIKRGERNVISRRYHAKDDKEAIATWRLDFNGILRVFNTELLTNTRATVPDIRHDAATTSTTAPDTYHSKPKGLKGTNGQNQATHASAPGESLPPSHGPASGTHRDAVSEVQTMVSDVRRMLKSQEGRYGPQRSTQDSAPGELPPPSPRAVFGRDELIERIVHFAERLMPIALLGAGGICKTFIILTVLHDDRIKQRFGDNRRFIRCDEFPASCPHFLRRLSKVIGAGIENPEDLASLRRHLSSKEMLIVLDNAESILDPQGTSAREIYAAVNELTQFSNICFCITSRISTIPPDCEIFEIPTLSAEAACDTFYRIYKRGEKSDLINSILQQLDFHPLSITLLATVAQYNKWDASRLTKEWERQRTGVLQAEHSGSLATTIELSLASPMFRELGTGARELLGVAAFFPQGINEENAEWLLPTISDGPNMFDKFCILSLTYRTNGFVTMLAPLRDHLRPKDPTSSLLLSTARDHYFSRLSARIHPNNPDFEESRWIVSEDVNVEHLLDVFTSVDANSGDVWDTCSRFMDHLYWRRPRLTMLGPRIEALPDDHPFKPQCLENLSWLFYSVGNRVERKRILTHTLQLWRERGVDDQVALTLDHLSDANRTMGFLEEGIRQVKEASEIFEQLGNMVGQAECLTDLARALNDDKQLDAAEEAASRAIDLLPEKGQQFLVCEAHRTLGAIYHSKGETKKAIHHFEKALGIASPLGAVIQLFWVHFALATLVSEEGRLNDAHAHIEQAKLHAVNDAYNLARASWLQAKFWNKQHMFEKAKSEALRAFDVLEKLGATGDAKEAREFLDEIDRNAREDERGSSHA